MNSIWFPWKYLSLGTATHREHSKIKDLANGYADPNIRNDFLKNSILRNLTTFKAVFIFFEPFMDNFGRMVCGIVLLKGLIHRKHRCYMGG
ncbi:hypothetical protein TNIN_131671 [Trichonephila inaurata madagascariensis]|uniref:Uncharacterized protein n=1 Tax=Trichonephila inaurata madagascariensis TaxID=2747483 RepID=A0A8X6YFP6_9ARAC|nr:hypothetical protein TNIN_131671 [Trichonephila inaurata madagascariensis]